MSSGTSLFLSLFNTLAIVIVLVAVHSALIGYLEESGRALRSAVLGLAFGLFASAGMHVAIPVAEGVVVDQRYAIVVLSGAFGGPVSATVSVVMAGAYRLFLGGTGTLAGSLTIVLAGLVGTLFFVFRERINTVPKAALAALAATLANLPLLFLVQDVQTGWELMKVMGLPYASATFLGIMLVGLLLAIGESRHASMRKLNLSEKRYRELFESQIDVSFRTNREGKLILVSPSAIEVFGYDPEETLGRDTTDLYLDPSRREEFLDELRRDGHVEGFETEMVRKDGEVLWVSTNAKLLTNEEGSFHGIEGWARDISLRKRAEEEKALLEAKLQQSQKMEAVGTLAGGIAHDFNNILGAVVGYTELVREDLPEESQDREYLDAVLEAADRATDLTHQILTFSRERKADKAVMKPCPVVEEAVRLLRKTIPSTVKITACLDADTGAVLADSTQLHQVIINLGTNAFHSLPDEMGEIDIQLQAVEVDQDWVDEHQALSVGRYARLKVRDTGRGIDEATQARMFDPFFTTKKVGQGTGMGLSVVHGIVEDHEGAVVVASEENVGSTFEVFLPISDEGAKPPPLTRPEPRTGTERILFVDDDPALVLLGKTVLEGLGYGVTATQSASDALERFRDEPLAFDLVFTDQTMPEIPGDKFASEVLSIRPEIPVIISTGYSAVLDAEKAKTLGVRALLMKPLDKHKLAEAVGSVFEEKA